jgi:hypothetical protein
MKNMAIIHDKNDQCQTYFRSFSDVRPFTEQKAKYLKMLRNNAKKNSNGIGRENFGEMYNVCITEVASYFGVKKDAEALHYESDIINAFNNSKNTFAAICTRELRRFSNEITSIKYHGGFYESSEDTGIVKKNLWCVGNRQRTRVYRAVAEAVFLNQTEEVQLNYVPVGFYCSVPFHAIALDLEGNIAVDTAPVRRDYRFMESMVLIFRRRGTTD